MATADTDETSSGIDGETLVAALALGLGVGIPLGAIGAGVDGVSIGPSTLGLAPMWQAVAVGLALLLFGAVTGYQVHTRSTL